MKKRHVLVPIGFFSLMISLYIFEKINDIKKATNLYGDEFSSYIQKGTDFNNPMSKDELTEASNHLFGETVGLFEIYIYRMMNIESAVMFLIFAIISILTGIFGKDFWKSFLSFIFPTP